MGLSAISLPDPTSQAPPLMKENDPMFISYWVCKNVGSSRGKEIYRTFFNPSDLKEDLVTLTGLGFMKTMVAFFDKKRVEAVMKPRYQFLDDDTGKKTYVKFKWEGEDLVINNSNLYMQEITLVPVISLRFTSVWNWCWKWVGSRRGRTSMCWALIW